MNSIVKTAQSAEGRRSTEAAAPRNSSVKTLLYGPASCTKGIPSQNEQPPETKDDLVEEEAAKITSIGQMKSIHFDSANKKADTSIPTVQAVDNNNASIQEEDRSKVTTTNTSIYDDDPDSSFVETFHGLAPNPELPLEGPSAPAFLGFQSVASGKEITISDEHMMKAAKILDMNQGAPPPNESSKEPPPAMLGFQTVGSGKAITVSDEHMIKAAKILDVHQDDTSTSFIDNTDKSEA